MEAMHHNHQEQEQQPQQPPPHQPLEGQLLQRQRLRRAPRWTRVSAACDGCHGKKVRCPGPVGACANCAARRIPCAVLRPLRPRRPSERIAVLRSRIALLEETLSSSQSSSGVSGVSQSSGDTVRHLNDNGRHHGDSQRHSLLAIDALVAPSSPSSQPADAAGIRAAFGQPALSSAAAASASAVDPDAGRLASPLPIRMDLVRAWFRFCAPRQNYLILPSWFLADVSLQPPILLCAVYAQAERLASIESYPKLAACSASKSASFRTHFDPSTSDLAAAATTNIASPTSANPLASHPLQRLDSISSPYCSTAAAAFATSACTSSAASTAAAAIISFTSQSPHPPSCSSNETRLCAAYYQAALRYIADALVRPSYPYILSLYLLANYARATGRREAPLFVTAAIRLLDVLMASMNPDPITTSSTSTTPNTTHHTQTTPIASKHHHHHNTFTSSLPPLPPQHPTRMTTTSCGNELIRRLWWSLYECDRQIALESGLPHLDIDLTRGPGIPSDSLQIQCDQNRCDFSYVNLDSDASPCTFRACRRDDTIDNRCGSLRNHHSLHHVSQQHVFVQHCVSTPHASIHTPHEPDTKTPSQSPRIATSSSSCCRQRVQTPPKRHPHTQQLTQPDDIHMLTGTRLKLLNLYDKATDFVRAHVSVYENRDDSGDGDVWFWTRVCNGYGNGDDGDGRSMYSMSLKKKPLLNDTHHDTSTDDEPGTPTPPKQPKQPPRRTPKIDQTLQQRISIETRRWEIDNEIQVWRRRCPQYVHEVLPSYTFSVTDELVDMLLSQSRLSCVSMSERVGVVMSGGGCCDGGGCCGGSSRSRWMGSGVSSSSSSSFRSRMSSHPKASMTVRGWPYVNRRDNVDAGGCTDHASREPIPVTGDVYSDDGVSMELDSMVSDIDSTPTTTIASGVSDTVAPVVDAKECHHLSSCAVSSSTQPQTSPSVSPRNTVRLSTHTSTATAAVPPPMVTRLSRPAPWAAAYLLLCFYYTRTLLHRPNMHKRWRLPSTTTTPTTTTPHPITDNLIHMLESSRSACIESAHMVILIAQRFLEQNPRFAEVSTSTVAMMIAEAGSVMTVLADEGVCGTDTDTDTTTGGDGDTTTGDGDCLHIHGAVQWQTDIKIAAAAVNAAFSALSIPTI